MYTGKSPVLHVEQTPQINLEFENRNKIFLTFAPCIFINSMMINKCTFNQQFIILLFIALPYIHYVIFRELVVSTC
jgi:hypothetical protein